MEYCGVIYSLCIRVCAADYQNTVRRKMAPKIVQNPAQCIIAEIASVKDVSRANDLEISLEP